MAVPPINFVFIALQHMRRHTFCNQNYLTNVIAVATRLPVSIDKNRQTLIEKTAYRGAHIRAKGWGKAG